MKKTILFLLCVFLISQAQAQDPITAESLGFGFKTYNEGTAFSTIAFDSVAKKVWAGTAQNGIYSIATEDAIPAGDFSLFGGTATGGPNLSTVRIQSMVADGLGNLWVGHRGIGSAETQGGIERVAGDLSVTHFRSDRDARGYSNEGLPFLQADGLGTRDVKSLTTDMNNTLWAAQKSHQLLVTNPTVFIVTPGTISYKTNTADLFESISTWKDYQEGNQAPELPYPAFTYNPGPTETAQTRNMQAISSDSTSVWVGAWNYLTHDDPNVLMKRRILRYNLDGSYANQSFEYESDMNFPPGGIVNGICTNNSKGIWVTTSFTNKGFSVYDGTGWTYMNPLSNASNIIPPGTRFNDNAIWKNAYGNVFMGTTKGLLVYDGRGTVSDPSSYTLYSNSISVFPSEDSPNLVVDPNMVSINITSGVSEKEGIQWMATSGGIMRVMIGYIPTGEFVNTPSGTFYSTDYKSCDNEHMNFVESEFVNRPNDDPTYHKYELKTIICDATFNNRPYCTVENVFQLMKEDVSYQAVIPTDFPYDFATQPFLDLITDSQTNTLVDVINQQIAPITQIEFMLIDQNFPYDQNLIDALYKQGALFNFLAFFNDTPIESNFTRSHANGLQLSFNERKSINCEEYRLYNPPDYLLARKIFINNQGVSNFFNVCNGTIGFLEYDPIVLFIDEKNYKMVNYTVNGHGLYPGKVTREVKRDESGQIVIITTGEGYHFCGGFVGEQAAKSNLINGSILFKNVDRRLFEKFKSLNEN